MATKTEVFNDDSHIYNTYPTTNYGTSATMNVEYTTADGKDFTLAYSFARVDFSDATDITVDNVTSATANLMCSGRLVNIDPFNLMWFKVLRSWDEAYITWERYGNGLYWGTYGCALEDVDQDTDIRSDTKNMRLAESGTWYAWDIWGGGGAASMIKDAIQNCSKVWNAKLWGDATGNGSCWVGFYTSEVAEPTYRPYIEITYTAAGGVTKTQVFMF